MSEATARPASVFLPSAHSALRRRLLLLLMRVLLLLLMRVLLLLLMRMLLVMMSSVDGADLMLSAQCGGVGVGRLFTSA